jgi:hypothetical protein
MCRRNVVGHFHGHKTEHWDALHILGLALATTLYLFGF